MAFAQTGGHGSQRGRLLTASPLKINVLDNQLRDPRVGFGGSHVPPNGHPNARSMAACAQTGGHGSQRGRLLTASPF